MQGEVSTTPSFTRLQGSTTVAGLRERERAEVVIFSSLSLLGCVEGDVEDKLPPVAAADIKYVSYFVIKFRSVKNGPL